MKLRRRGFLCGGAVSAAGLGAGGARAFRLSDPGRRRPDLTDANLDAALGGVMQKTERQVLVIGNSATIQSGFMPALQSQARAHAVPVNMVRAAANGARLIGSYQIEKLRRLVHAHPWDIVVLQDFSSTALHRADRLGSVAAIMGFARLASPAKVVLFPHWPSGPKHRVYRGGLGHWYDVPSGALDYAARSRAHYRKASSLTGAVLAPVLQAWTDALDQGHEIYAKDHHHSNETGAKLAAAALWSTVEQLLNDTHQAA